MILNCAGINRVAAKLKIPTKATAVNVLPRILYLPTTNLAIAGLETAGPVAHLTDLGRGPGVARRREVSEAVGGKPYCCPEAPNSTQVVKKHTSSKYLTKMQAKGFPFMGSSEVGDPRAPMLLYLMEPSYKK